MIEEIWQFIIDIQFFRQSDYLFVPQNKIKMKDFL